MSEDSGALCNEEWQDERERRIFNENMGLSSCRKSPRPNCTVARLARSPAGPSAAGRAAVR